MALSVRLPPGRGPYIEHYLIEADDTGCLSLESSDNQFHSIPSLVAHYSQCCDELPVELCLPRIIREAKTRQQLSSLALLGQEFWRYPMANPRRTPCEEESPDNQTAALEELAIAAQSPVELRSDTVQIGCSAAQSPVESLPSSSSQASSLSSFASGSSPSPCQEEPLVLRLSPLQIQPSQATCLSTFKTTSPTLESGPSGWCTDADSDGLPLTRAARPTPPDSLDLVTTTGGRLGRGPPLPPPRSVRPPSTSNLTVTTTTTVTFSMTQSQVGGRAVDYREEGKCSLVSPATVPVSPPLHSCAVTSPISPCSYSSCSQPTRRLRSQRQSSHYRESDILESAAVYSPDPFIHKGSDYEDVWGAAADRPESQQRNAGCVPDLQQQRGAGCVPDLQQQRGAGCVPDLQQQRGAGGVPDLQQQRGAGCVPDPQQQRGAGCVPDLLARPRPRPAPRPSLFLPPPPPVSPSDTSPTADPPTKQTQSSPSPFYCEPADAIPRRRLDRINSLRNKRHSDPSALIHWPPTYASDLQTIDSKEELVSTSVDDLSVLRRSGRRFSLLKPNRHSKRLDSKKISHNNWTIDSSWQFIGHEDEAAAVEPESEEGRPGAVSPLQLARHNSETSTLHHLIALRLPELVLPEDLSSCPDMTDDRVSAYDNLTQQPPVSRHHNKVVIGDSAPAPVRALDDPTLHQLLSERESGRRATVRAEGSCTGGAATIRSYVLQLAADGTTVFSQAIDNFIRCTTESRETRSHVVMRNMRQFMSGIKNYLVKHGERDFTALVENQRAKLKANEFLNLDAILEGVLERVVVKPLRPHLHRLFVEEYSASGAIHLMADNIHYARTQPLHHLGIRRKVTPPNEEALEKICCHLHKLQQVDSPLEKLENLLASIATIFKSVEVELGADELLPLFAWVLVQVGMVSAEMEAEYMWGLLDPSLLSGEPGYYLTTLSSAVHVIKSLRVLSNHTSQDTKSVLRVVVPDELNGSIITKTLPVKPHMTTRDLSKIIAHKLRITNPQDYALYRLIDGEESLLNESDCPQDLGPELGKHCMFAYKRIDAKIAWPINTD